MRNPHITMTAVLLVCLSVSIIGLVHAGPSWMKQGAYATYNVKMQGILAVGEVSWRVVSLNESAATILESAQMPTGPVNDTKSYDLSTRRSLSGSRGAFQYAFEWINPGAASIGDRIPIFNINGTDYNMYVAGTTPIASREALELAPEKWNTSRPYSYTHHPNDTHPFPVPSGNWTAWGQNMRIRIFYDKETGILLGAILSDPSNIFGGNLEISKTNILSLKTDLPPYLALAPLLAILGRKLRHLKPRIGVHHSSH